RTRKTGLEDRTPAPLSSRIAVFTVCGALAQQRTVTIRADTIANGTSIMIIQGAGQWYRGEEQERHEYPEHHCHNGYSKDATIIVTRTKTAINIPR
ncbi:MAG TPA: hypothetical protein VI114_11110, partial [Chthoniobacterales bacterium]